MPGERARRVSTERLIRKWAWFWACAVLAALAAYVGLGALSRAVEPAPASVSALALTAATALEAASGDPVVAAAGDIACDPSNSNFNGGNGVSNSCRQKAVSDLIFNQGYDGVLLLGDNQYYCGGYTAHLQSYDLSWGRFKSMTKPSPGNHEYLTSGGTDCNSLNAGADGYFKYFGALAGEKGKGYYAFDIGAWHVIVLNSHCSGAGGCSSSTPQGQFLRNELATHTNVCTLAYWHVPYYSSGGRDDASYKTFWDALYQYDADLVLSGHDHTYERFAPQTPSRTLDNVRGIRQFVVGTGGSNHTSLATTMANSEVRNDDTFGVLRLTLRPTSYDWEFVPEPGKTFTDSGSTNCHGKSSDTTPPSTPTGLTATASSSNKVDLTWNPSTDNVSVEGYRIYRNGSLVATVTTGTSYSDTTVAAKTSYSYTVAAYDAGLNASSQSAPAAVTTPGDTGVPTAPTSLAASSVAATEVKLTWTASTDNVAVAGYRIFRDSVEIGTSSTPAYTDSTVQPEKTYSYFVRAYDAENNVSPNSNTISVTTPGLPSTLTFTPAADASIRSDLPATNYGSSSVIGIDSSPVEDLLLKFTVSGTAGRPIQSVKLRLYCNNAGGSGGVFKRVGNTSWSESGVTWGNAPAADSATLATLGATTVGRWYEVDVTPLVTGNGTYSLRVSGTSTDGTDYTSKEGAAGFAPQLVVTVQNVGDSTPPTAPTNLVATASGPKRVDLTWTASTDNDMVARYRIYRNLVQVGTSTTPTYIDTGVLPSTTYRYDVVAEDPSGNVSAGSNTANVTTPADTTPPSTPANLTAAAVSPTRIDLTWDASTDDVGVYRYRIRRDGVQIATSLMPSYSDTTAAEGTSYSYTVDAIDAAGNASAPSNTATATTPVTPTTVTPTADASLRSDLPSTNYGSATVIGIDSTPAEDLLLKFNVTGVNGRGVASAKLRLFCTDAGGSGGVFKRVADSSWSESSVTWGSAPAPEAATIATLGATTAGVWYEIDVTSAVTADGLVSFRASSTDANGTDYSSKEGTAGNAPQLIVTPKSRPPDTEPPTQPTTLLATAPGPTRVDLGWTASTDNVGVAGYRIYRDGVQIATTTAASYSDLTAKPSTAYAYHVVAYDEANLASAPSNTANITTPADTTPPTAPSGLAALVVSPTRVDLTWNASSDDVGVDRYRILRDGAQIATSIMPSYSDTTAAEGTSYSYTVDAIDAAGNISAASNTANATTPVATSTFTPVADTSLRSDFPTTNYGNQATVAIDGSPARDLLLKFNVTGVNGRGVASAKLRLYCTNPGGGGGAFKRVADSGWGETTVNWNNAPATDGATLATIGPTSSGTWYEIDVTSAVTGDGLVSFRASTSSADGTEYESKEGTAGRPPQLVVTPKSGPPDTEPPTQPMTLLATAPSPTRVDLVWNASTDNVGVAGYRIYRDGTQIGTSTTPSYSDLTAKPSTAYAYHVIAYDAAPLDSAPSNTANITTPADTTPPTAPTSLSGTAISQTRVDLSWSASTDDVGVTGYRVFRDGIQIGTSAGASYSDMTAVEGTLYSYAVDAVDAAGNISASSNTANATTPVVTSTFTPVADTSLRSDLPTTNYGTQTVVGIDSTPGQDLLLKFDVTGVNGRGVASAKLRLYCTDAGGSGGVFKRAAGSGWGETTVNWNTAPAGEGATLATLGPTTAGTWYEIDVTAAVTGDGLVSFRASSTDANGTDYSSKEGTAGRAPQLVVTPKSGPPDTEPPSQPRTLLASAPSPTRVDLVWTGSTDNVAIAGYRIYRDGTQIGTSASAAYSDLTAQPNTVYAYHVIAYDAANNASAPSNTASITTPGDTTAPTAPTSLAAVAVSQTRVDLTWAASTDNIGVTGYRVFRGGAQIGTSTGTSYSDTTVVGSTTYNYQVAAVDAASNQSAFSNTATVTTASTSLLKFEPTGDATIQQDLPTTASGTSATIMVDNSPVKHMLLKFTVSGVGGRTVRSAKLRLYCTNPSGAGGVFARATTSSWSEATVTWNTAPAAGSTIRTLGAVAAGSWYEVDVTSLITGDGTYSLRVSSTSADGAEYSSKEGANRPELVVDAP